MLHLLNSLQGKPFRPYEQLMGVMPAASNHTIPEPFHPLMTEEESDIKDFYPEDFEVDLNGKKFAWQGVALLPFIDEKRLLAAMATKYPMLSTEEHARNAFGKDALLFSSKHPLHDDVITHFYSKKAGAPKLNLDAKVSEGLSGKVEKNEDYIPSSALTFPLPGDTPFDEIDDDQSIAVHYSMPTSNHIHKSMLLPGLIPPRPVLDYGDIESTRNRSQKTGRGYGGVPFDNQNGRGGRFNYGNDDRRNGGGYQNDRNGHGGNGYGGNGYGGQNGGYDRRGPPHSGGQYGAPQAQQTQFSLPPHLAAQAAQHGFPGAGFAPPPPVPGWMPGMPPAPPSNGGQGYGGNGGYNGGYHGGRNGGYNDGHNGGGGRDGYRGGRGGDYNRRY